MSYIYKITNNCNGKIYIGQSRIPIGKKWKTHLCDSKKVRDEKRPLYSAMDKYGIENFSISVVEEIDDNSLLDEREIYWINYYDSFRNGYNATYGGAGRNTIDYGLVYETYKQVGGNCKLAANALGIDEGRASFIIRALSGSERLPNPKVQSKRINMFSQSGEYIRTFSSSRDAARYLIQANGLNPLSEGGYSRHICDVCKGKRKTANGYIWRYTA